MGRRLVLEFLNQSQCICETEENNGHRVSLQVKKRKIMDIDTPDVKRYLTELCKKTQGDTGAQVSMFEVGEAIGLEKTDAGMMAEELIVEGLAELRSLSGGISITAQGLEMIQGTAGGPALKGSGLQLGSEQVLGEQGRQAVEIIIRDIRGALVSGKTTFGQMEEIVIDIKTIEIQMLSPRPKTDVIRAACRSLQAGLTAFGFGKLAAEVDSLIAR